MRSNHSDEIAIEELIETLGTHCNVPEDAKCKLCFSYKTLARTNEKRIDLELSAGEETPSADRDFKLDDGSAQELTIDDLQLCVKHNRGGVV